MKKDEERGHTLNGDLLWIRCVTTLHHLNDGRGDREASEESGDSEETHLGCCAGSLMAEVCKLFGVGLFGTVLRTLWFRLLMVFPSRAS